MIFQKVSDTSTAEGVNWEYYRIGTLKMFKQTGKVKSLRNVKIFIKECHKLIGDGDRVVFGVEE